jgi:rhodanese-related sulfurtransferase
MRTLLAVLLVSMPACAPTRETTGAAAPSAAASDVRDIDVATLHAGLASHAYPTVLDVRTPEEYAGGHVPGARNVPVEAVDALAGDLRAAGSDVVLVCASGGRSARAARSLAAQGVRAVNVLGGTQAWVAAGYEVAR